MVTGQRPDPVPARNTVTVALVERETYAVSLPILQAMQATSPREVAHIFCWNEQDQVVIGLRRLSQRGCSRFYPSSPSCLSSDRRLLFALKC